MSGPLRRAGRLVQAARRAAARARPTWSGVYAHLRDVPVGGPGFTGDVWLEATRAQTRHALDAFRAGHPIPPAWDHGLLVALAGAVALGRDRIRILDMGGGMGVDYVYIRAALPPSTVVEHAVVENEAVCAAGRVLYGPEDTITFAPALPEHAPGLDIVHCRSVLQYVEDYEGVLRRLLRYGARYAFFVELAAGDVPTYATAQLNVRGSVIPCWFHSLDELVAIAAEEGYAPLMRSTSERTLPAAAVPPSHRLEHPSNVLFGRVHPT